MNLVKFFEKKIEQGYNNIDIDGELVSVEKMKKRALRDYNAGVKAGDIDPMDKSFKEYFFDDADQYLPVDCLIDFIKGGQTFVNADDLPEETNTDVETENKKEE